MPKVLIITYYWPPAGGPGVQRILGFVRYLPMFGWEPVVVTVLKGDYSNEDPSLLQQVPEKVKVYKIPAREPFNLYRRLTGKKRDEKIPTHILAAEKNQSFRERLSRFIRLNFFIPDARIGWIPYLTKTGTQIVQKEIPDILISSSPPHSLQLATKKIARKTDIKWIADFRDPWTDFFHYQEKGRLCFARYLDRYFEKSILKSVDAAVTVSPSLSALFKKKVPTLKATVITNGFDLEEYNGLIIKKHPHFTLFYAGSMRKSQCPMTFFDALQALIKKGKTPFNIRIAGSIHPHIKQAIEERDLTESFTFLGYLEHRKVLQEMINAHLLLLLIPNTEQNEGILTGKLFEYMASGTPILGFGPEQGDAAAILKETKTGIMIDYDKDPTSLLEIAYDAVKVEQKQGKHHIPDAVLKYSRYETTRKLAELLEDIL